MVSYKSSSAFLYLVLMIQSHDIVVYKPYRYRWVHHGWEPEVLFYGDEHTSASGTSGDGDDNRDWPGGVAAQSKSRIAPKNSLSFLVRMTLVFLLLFFIFLLYITVFRPGWFQAIERVGNFLAEAHKVLQVGARVNCQLFAWILSNLQFVNAAKRTFWKWLPELN